jgi:hypothetical protein
MSREGATELLAGRLARYRTYSYEQLAKLVGSCEVEELTGVDGTPYQLEFEFLWDDRPAGDVRVIGGIDGGDISALTPLTAAFIVSSNGSFVDE